MCDSDGQVASSEECGLDCGVVEPGDTPRCGVLVASNGLSDIAPQGAFALDLDLSQGATIAVDEGTITPLAAAISTLIPAPPGGVPIRVFFARNVILGNVRVEAHLTGTAIAFVALEDIRVVGNVELVAAAEHSPGGVETGASVGEWPFAMVGSIEVVAGDPGGGHATPGGKGGELEFFESPHSVLGGQSAGTVELVPLRGGGGAPGPNTVGIGGGGAIQLSAGRGITIEGRIDARGAGGVRMTRTGRAKVGGTLLTASMIGGGGAGGGILLEAPTVSLTGASALLATGGAGASFDAVGGRSNDGTPAMGAAATTPNAGGGGNGGTTDVAAQDGHLGVYTGSTSGYGGGGGGGVGRIRINTRTGAFSIEPSAVVAGQTTTGMVVFH